MNDETPTGTILSRIQTAAGLFASGNKMKYQAIAEFYAVYLEAKDDPALAAEIETEYSAKIYPKTDLLTNKVLWLGFAAGTARQRISDMHRLLLECEKQNKQPAELVDWFTAESGWRNVLNQAVSDEGDTAKTTKNKSRSSTNNGSGGDSGGNGSGHTKLFKALQSLQEEAKYRSSTDAPPIPIACDTGEYLIQVCCKVSAGKFETYWAKATEAGLVPISVAALSSALSQAA